MKILFVHQNFPGQFPHLAPALAARGHQVLALTDQKNGRPSPVQVVKYKSPDPIPQEVPSLAQSYVEHTTRGYLAARGARALRDRHDYVPDVIFGHSGWGETLFLKEIWPDARLLIYAELIYRPHGHDIGFDPEITPDSDEARMSSIARGAHLLIGITQADAALAPTRFQANSFPPELRDKITVIHDGIDTTKVMPDPQASVTMPNGTVLRAGDPVITYVSRSMEPYRGFHVFMRALPEVLAARPDAHVVMVGATDRVSYGAKPKDALNWYEKMLAELGGGIDLNRVHFLGRVGYEQYLRVLQIGRAHVYLTYPFVLSWSLTEAMAAGCNIIASDTEPVRELIRHGHNGQLIGFFNRKALVRRMLKALEGPTKAETARRRAARQTILDGYDLHRYSLPRLIDWVESFDPAKGWQPQPGHWPGPALPV
ncbi:MAG: glycosyltransferase [Paracoccus sp. (in: a-proteobacteria)]|uniref:glycosyltransferase n=1 Tax=Paracoccus sp. TaxID=267 RepID=UPI0026DEE89F|nr:glycosyltransferase [Paracoccus sp. (in: a-proteobacteria)]MDO5622008.1 glycosyltransferase [Paracoccus sp. (in: a-proteobacteria)]